jgi:hypothetical protein
MHIYVVLAINNHANYRPQKDTKTMPSLKTTKESPSGGEKLLRLLASGTAGTKDMQPKQTPANTEGIKNMPLNFAQGNYVLDVYS